MKDLNIDILKPKDVSHILNVTTKTLIEWDKSGKLTAFRTSTNKRYYTREQIYDFLQIENKYSDDVVIYCRVSNDNQKDDLKNQIQALKDYCQKNNIKPKYILTDIGSGLNYSRKNWNLLLHRVESREISKIIISYKDRFVRFGYEWFNDFCRRFGCQIIVAFEEEDKQPEEEMIEDLISIIHVFSCKIYGLRKYKKKEDLIDDIPENSIKNQK